MGGVQSADTNSLYDYSQWRLRDVKVSAVVLAALWPRLTLKRLCSAHKAAWMQAQTPSAMA